MSCPYGSQVVAEGRDFGDCCPPVVNVYTFVALVGGVALATYFLRGVVITTKVKLLRIVPLTLTNLTSLHLRGERGALRMTGPHGSCRQSRMTGSPWETLLHRPSPAGPLSGGVCPGSSRHFPPGLEHPRFPSPRRLEDAHLSR